MANSFTSAFGPNATLNRNADGTFYVSTPSGSGGWGTVPIKWSYDPQTESFAQPGTGKTVTASQLGISGVDPSQVPTALIQSATQAGQNADSWSASIAKTQAQANSTPAQFVSAIQSGLPSIQGYESKQGLNVGGLVGIAALGALAAFAGPEVLGALGATDAAGATAALAPSLGGEAAGAYGAGTGMLDATAAMQAGAAATAGTAAAGAAGTDAAGTTAASGGATGAPATSGLTSGAGEVPAATSGNGLASLGGTQADNLAANGIAANLGGTVTQAQIAQIAASAGVPVSTVSAAVTAAGTAAGTSVGQGILQKVGIPGLLQSLGVDAATAATLAPLLSATIPALAAAGAAAYGISNQVKPNVTFGPNSVVSGPNGSTVTLDPQIAATQTAGLGINNALSTQAQNALTANQAAQTTYQNTNAGLQTQNNNALSGYTSAIAPVSNTLSGVQTDLTGLQGTETANNTAMQSAVGGAQASYGGELGQSNANLSTFQNALAPVSNTLNTTGADFQSLYDKAGANQGGYVQSVVNPIIQANDIQYGNTVRDFGDRGLSGSSFATDALGNLVSTQGTAVSNATAQALQSSLGLQGGFATSLQGNALDQQGVAQAGYNAGNTTVNTNAGLTTDAFNAAQAGFNAGTTAVNTNAALSGQQAAVAGQQAGVAQQGFGNAQTGITTGNTLSGAALTAANTGLGNTDASIGVQSGLNTNNQNIVGNMTNTATNVLGLGGNVNNQATNNATSTNNMVGSALGAAATGLTGTNSLTGYSQSPIGTPPGPNYMWNGYNWAQTS